jgi:hypothetical protein
VVGYVNEKFPAADLSQVKIYRTSNAAMKAAGLDNMGGCYVDLLKVIFVLDEKSLNKQGTANGKFDRLLMKETWTPLKMVDILIHEVLHAVSSAIGRATQRYTNAEEEFVYTHCVDFYKQEGMANDDIIRTHFLQFCLADVLSSKEELAAIFTKLKSAKNLRYVPWERDYDKYQYEDFLNRHAEYLVPQIVQAATDKANTMIECYHKYGCSSASASEVDYSTSMRFQSLNFD